MAHAWDDYTDSQVIAWTNLNRTGNESDRAVMIAPGVWDDGHVGEPLMLDVRSKVAPGLACELYQAAGSWDCVVAYINQDTRYSYIRFRHFYLQQTGPTTYSWDWRETESYLNDHPQSGLALWRHSGYWWLAFRSREGNLVRVYWSDDAVAWEHFTNLGYSITGPQVASDGGDIGSAYVYVTRP